MSRTGPRRCAWSAAVAIACLAGAHLAAFGDAGHRVIGLVAELHLADARAIGEVRRILPPGETLVEASVWPDTIRAAHYEDEDTPLYRLAHPAHDTYHYTNIPFRFERYAPGLTGTHAADIVQTARECIRVLRGQSQAFTRRAALRVLAHLVGDIHQPLHVGNAFVSTSGPLRFVLPGGPAGWRSAAGGNALRYGPKDSLNLHAYWDGRAVDLALQQQDVRTYAARLVKERGVQASWRNTGSVESWPEQWATEVLPLARQAHDGIRLLEHLPPDSAGWTGHRWRIAQPPGYDALARKHVPDQLARGGYRLAATLKAIWPD